jgi:hypothetical protein
MLIADLLRMSGPRMDCRSGAPGGLQSSNLTVVNKSAISS